MRSGRAVLLPVYQGLYERRGTSPAGPSGERDLIIQQYRDFRRAVDYLDTRADIARDQLGFFGISGGSQMGLLSLPEEPRIRAAVLAEVGLSPARKPPELDEINFAPRVRIPVLMLNGRYDIIPVETVQLPMFHLLGTPEKEKRYVQFDTGHASPAQQYIKETLDWFDRYLGRIGTNAFSLGNCSKVGPYSLITASIVSTPTPSMAVPSMPVMPNSARRAGSCLFDASTSPHDLARVFITVP